MDKNLSPWSPDQSLADAPDPGLGRSLTADLSPEAVGRRLEAALDRVATEREHVEKKQTAFDRFATTVRETSSSEPVGGFSGQAGGGTTTLSPVVDQRQSDDRCRRIRERFGETVHPCSVEDLASSEPVLATIRAELGDGVARQLAPDAGGRFTSEVKRAVSSATRQRRAEIDAMLGALDREAKSIQTAIDETEAIQMALFDACNADPLMLGFDELCDRHARIGSLRDRCDQLASERQQIVHATTSHGGTAGLTHRSLLTYLYDDLRSSFPILSSIVDLDAVCVDCQRQLRDQLTRRV